MRFEYSVPSSLLRSGLAALAGILLLTAPALGQQPAPPQQPQEEIPDSIQEMMTEFEETRQRFDQLHTRALEENPELQERQEAIGEMVNDAIAEIDPESEARMDRLAALEREAQAAQQQEDMDALQALVMEAQGIQQALQEAQEQALEREDIQNAIEEFQDDVLDEMKKLDPEAEDLLDRLQELAERLMAQQGPPSD
jgi:chromosome segregation ATPase